MERFSQVFELDRDKIKVDPERFQGRQEKFSKDTTDAIVNKGYYDKSGEPIIVWYDKDIDKYIVISGHSRFQATQILYETGKQDNLKTIPVKEFKGTETQAQDYAILESNRGGTEEGLISDIKAYKRAVEKGYNRKNLLTIFKPESKLNKLKDLSYLNENGKFLYHLAQPSSASFPFLERNATWVGLLRSYLPQLTNAHENEIFDYIYKGSGLKLEKDKLFKLIENKANNLLFDPENPLNLENVVSTSAYTNPINEQIKDLQKEIETNQATITKAVNNIARAKQENTPDVLKLIPKFEEQISQAQKFIIYKTEEIQRLRTQIGNIEKSPVTDLFSQVEPEEIKPKTEEKAKETIKAQSMQKQNLPEGTKIYKNLRGELVAETIYKDLKGWDWEITTRKRDKNNIQCLALALQTNIIDGGVYKMFSFDTPRIVLFTEQANRVTEDKIKEVHFKGLAVFDLLKSKNELPERTEKTEEKGVKIGQRVVFKGGIGGNDKDNLIVYEITKGNFGNNQYKLIDKETLKFRFADEIRPIDQTNRIGYYYKPGEAVLPFDEVANLVADGYKIEAENKLKSQANKLVQEQEIETKIEEGKQKIKIPIWAKAVIVADLYENKSDSQTDYYSTSVVDRVFLEFSKTDRANLKEYNNPAKKFDETKQFADNKEYEVRDYGNYLPKYFLGTKKWYGWKVHKVKLENNRDYDSRYISSYYSYPNEIYIAVAEGKSYLQQKNKPEQKEVDIKEISFELKEFKHSVKGYTIYVASPVNRLTKEQFSQVLKTAKQFNGYYSAYSKDGAIPGFHFKTIENREDFVKNYNFYIDPESLKEGAKIEEKEHNLGEKASKKIAEDHLKENPEYYEKDKTKKLTTEQLKEKYIQQAKKSIDENGYILNTPNLATLLEMLRMRGINIQELNEIARGKTEEKPGENLENGKDIMAGPLPMPVPSPETMETIKFTTFEPETVVKSETGKKALSVTKKQTPLTDEEKKILEQAEVEAIKQAQEENLSEAQVIAMGRYINSLRSLRSQAIDNKSDSKRRLSPTRENLIRWANNPGKFDLIGVDTFQATNPTADIKKITKQKLFNLFGIKMKVD